MAGGKRFPYGAKRIPLVAGGVAFGLGGIFFVHLAQSGEAVRLWPLPVYVSGGPVYGLAALAFAFPIAVVALLVRSRQLGPRELVVDEEFLEAPLSPWKADRVRLTRERIKSVERTDVNGTKFVALLHDGGKLTLSNANVGDEGLAAVEEWLREAS